MAFVNNPSLSLGTEGLKLATACDRIRSRVGVVDICGPPFLPDDSPLGGPCQGPIECGMRPKRPKHHLIVAAAVALLLAGCASTPPAGIRSAISTMNRHMPEYVAESNAALKAQGHPDAERLAGNGERLRDAMEALDKWANPEGGK